MRETLTQFSQPQISLDQSTQNLPFGIMPHPEEFAKLAIAVGIPESELKNLHIKIRKRGFLDQLGSYSHVTKGITIGIKGKRDQKKLLNTVAHELDHYNYFLTHPVREPSRWRRLLNAYSPGIEYLSRPQEVQARRTARRIIKSHVSYNLATFSDRPKR